MNIKTQLCGVTILVIGLLLYCCRKTLDTFSKRAFVRFYFLTFACIVLDILSIVAIEKSAYLPQLLVTIACKGYLLSLAACALCGIMYVGVDIVFYVTSFKKIEIITALATFVACIAICILPISIYCDLDTHIVYTYGPAAIMTYIGAVGLILWNFICIVKYGQYIQERRKNAMLLWMVIWFISALIQFLNPQILVVGFGSCLGVVIIYLQYENPEINLDRESGMFNQTAFYQFIQQVYYTRESYAVFAFVNDHRFARNRTQLAMEGLTNALLNTPGTYVFKTADDEIIALVKAEVWKKFGTETVEEMTIDEVNRHEENNNLKIFFMEDCLLVKKPEDFFTLLRYCRKKKIAQALEKFVYVDQTVIDDMNRENAMFKKVDDAIKSDRIEVFYQPIYSTHKKRFTSAEALVRMYDADGKMLPVYEAICASEESGQIHQIGEIVFEKVCQMICNEHIEDYGLEYIEINLSMAQCSDEKLADRYIRIMKKYAVNPKLINLEITESATIEMKQTLLNNMKKMIDYGIAFSLDDFGTGQSNLNYIVDMPVQIVKFDREMTKAYFESRKGQFVMNAAMHMIQGMKLHIVSEGIETKEQLETMEQLGIDYIQGFYFSKPLPLKEFIAFIKGQKMQPAIGKEG